VVSPSITGIGHYFSQRKVSLQVSPRSIRGIASRSFRKCYITNWVCLGDQSRCSYFSDPLLLLEYSRRGRISLRRSTSARLNIEIFSNPTSAITVLSGSFLDLASFVPMTGINLYCILQGFSFSFCSPVLVFLNIDLLFGRLLQDYLADNYGR